jgi:hypothetical protein
MAAEAFGKRTTRQPSLINAVDFLDSKLIARGTPCHVTAVAKRRDGGTRYWCNVHKSDATAKYGKPAKQCRAADEPPLRPADVLDLNLDKYLGGVALWGAVPAVYDTTRLDMDRGIHVHARPKRGAKKDIDWTWRAVRLSGSRLPKEGVLVNEIDAIYYMVSSVFGFQMSYIRCTHCGWAHLDKDFFSVHPHHRHLCAGCGRHFHDSEYGIGNPIMGVRQACGVDKHRTAPAKENLDIRQAHYPVGIQIWGSNAAFIWTGDHKEAEGIHVHAYLDGEAEPKIDETYNEVIIDGTPLDAEMVRVLMAQNVMPSLKDRVQSIVCPRCNWPQFDEGEAAYTTSVTHTCSDCGHEFVVRGRLRKTVANPLQAILKELAKTAPRKPQLHRLNLRPETL